MRRKAALIVAAGLLVGCGPAEQGLDSPSVSSSGQAPLGPGVVAPAIEAEGWLGPAPTASTWRGRVVVLDVWAYW